MTRFLLAASLVASLAAASPARAEDAKPFQLALFDPVQIVPATKSISGLSLALIYSKNANVTGLDLSFIATQVTGNMRGVQWSMVNLAGGDVTGAQLGFFNQAKHVEGLQFGLVNHTGTMHGLQIGLVNIIDKGGWLPVTIIVNGSF